MHRESGRDVEAVVARESGWLIAVAVLWSMCRAGNSSVPLHRDARQQYLCPTTMPASAMSKMHYFRVARHPDMIPNALRMLIVSP